MEQKKKYKNLPKALAFGVVIGIVAGVITDRLLLWFPMGIAIGLCFALMFNGMDEQKK